MTQSCNPRRQRASVRGVQGAVPLALSVGPIAVRIRHSGETEQAVIERLMMMKRADHDRGCKSVHNNECRCLAGVPFTISADKHTQLNCSVKSPFRETRR